MYFGQLLPTTYPSSSDRRECKTKADPIGS